MARQRILVVDDEPSIAETVAWLLQDEGYDAIIARNGAEGLSCAAEMGVDLVITDLMMPVMDGLTLSRRLRDDPATRDVPIVVATAVPALAKNAGFAFDGYLSKPFNLDGLLNLVAQILRGRQQAPREGSVAPA